MPDMVFNFSNHPSFLIIFETPSVLSSETGVSFFNFYKVERAAQVRHCMAGMPVQLSIEA